MYEDYKVRDDAPIPPIRHTSPRRRKYPFEELEVGRQFFVPGAKRASLGTHVSKVGKDLGKKFTARGGYANKIDGEWSPCEPHDARAVEGVFVCRIV